jgi:hypothetical protein
LSFLLFALSIATLGITISANRIIILLPFFVVFNLIALKEVLIFLKNKSILKKIFFGILLICFIVQVFESYLWVGLRFSTLPEQTSSSWVIKNIKQGTTIGLENIPIYQDLPDYVLKEFYNKQYYPEYNTRFNYVIVNSKTKVFPKYIIISNVYYEQKFYKSSAKDKLVAGLREIGYKEIERFPLQLPLYSLFDDYFYYPYMGLIAFPESISIFKK